MKNLLARFIKEEDGVTAIEYGMIAGLIAAVIAGTVTLIGTDLQTVFRSIHRTLSN
jgi:pilus assembly protein Flp/PilA